MRFAVSLKRSADPEVGQKWRLEHFSSANFAGIPSSSTRVSTVRDNIEFGLVNLQSGPVRTSEPWGTGAVGRYSALTEDPSGMGNLHRQDGGRPRSRAHTLIDQG